MVYFKGVKNELKNWFWATTDNLSQPSLSKTVLFSYKVTVLSHSIDPIEIKKGCSVDKHGKVKDSDGVAIFNSSQVF